jgi:hypothetical protein
MNDIACNDKDKAANANGGVKFDAKENSLSQSNGDAAGNTTNETHFHSIGDSNGTDMDDFNCIAEVNGHKAMNGIKDLLGATKSHSNGNEKSHLNGDTTNEVNNADRMNETKSHSNGVSIPDVNGEANIDCLSDTHSSDMSSDCHSDAKNSSPSDDRCDALQHRCLHCDFQTSFRGKLSTHLISKHSELRKEKKKN